MSNDFIEVYENAFSSEFCQKTIAYFEDMQDTNLIFSRQDHDRVGKLEKEDLALFLTDEKAIRLESTKDILVEFLDGFWKYYKQYASDYSILNELDKHVIREHKMQKTEVGQGYHVWHCEAMGTDTSRRVLVWTLYLNDVEEGGETEFLYQHKRVKPKEGTLVIWPAGFTHVHRGNPPLTNTKYIITGWVEF
jgi:hypothetical protein